ncbi:hypothetical protein TELCIR_13014 [Teladorsagia circumcincta]|uniref:Uncharacterized protein n=1 Tax=Teladorsagia circumcincta TaxID=45464 RepID=A0A2G9U6L0_TELCI|nr:hypothetical protein TELCIR_13014 [Teladorsagia circumcincta]
MVHANKTIMDKTLSKSTHLVKLRGVLYEPKCGEPTCFHEWFRNRDHNSNPVKEHIQLFDAIYPTVRNTVAVNVAGAADRRKLHRAYRVYCHQILAKVSTGEQDTGAKNRAFDIEMVDEECDRFGRKAVSGYQTGGAILKASMSRIVRPDVMTKAFSSLPDTKAPLLS